MCLMDLINHSEPAQTMSNILVDCICEDLNQGERGEQNDISGTPHSQPLKYLKVSLLLYNSTPQENSQRGGLPECFTVPQGLTFLGTCVII